MSEATGILDRPWCEVWTCAELPVRARKVLIRLGCVTVRHLCELSPQQLRDQRNFGDVSMKHLVDALARHGLKLRDEAPVFYVSSYNPGGAKLAGPYQTIAEARGEANRPPVSWGYREIIKGVVVETYQPTPKPKRIDLPPPSAVGCISIGCYPDDPEPDPDHCPKCGSASCGQIVYGSLNSCKPGELTPFSYPWIEANGHKRGGCCRCEDSPTKFCRDCGAEFGRLG